MQAWAAMTTSNVSTFSFGLIYLFMTDICICSI